MKGYVFMIGRGLITEQRLCTVPERANVQKNLFSISDA